MKLFGNMKVIALKLVVSLLGAFAVYYAFFLSSVLYELFGPNDYGCATPALWALQRGFLFFAPPALLGSVGLWFIGRRMDIVGAGFSRASTVSLGLFGLCVLVNLAFSLVL